jgi:hypothetical protein
MARIPWSMRSAPEEVERLPDVVRPGFLPGVRDAAQSFGRRGAEDVAEERGRVADLGGVQADADEVLPVAQRRPQRLHRLPRSPVPQEAQDQVRGDLVLSPSFGQPRRQSREHRPQRDAQRHVLLRVDGARRRFGSTGPGTTASW